MKDVIKLNLGCWIMKMEGWVNIDIDPRYGDVVMDCFNMSYPDNYADEIYAGHILEHTPDTDKALTEWKRVLKPGGIITVTVPDIEKAINTPVDTINIGNVGRQDYLNMIAFGRMDRKEEVHYHIFTDSILENYMYKYFKNVERVESPIWWETKMKGIK